MRQNNARQRVLCTLQLMNIASRSVVEECVGVIKTRLHNRRGNNGGHGVSAGRMCLSALVWNLDSEHNQTHTVTILNMLYRPTWVAVDVECCFRCVYLVVCVNLGPRGAVSRGEQNHYGWRWRTLLTAWLIKFYGGLWLMKSTAAYGGG